MSNKKTGNQTYIFNSAPVILSVGTVAGTKESEGPLGEYFDIRLDDSLYGKESWEKAERAMMCDAISTAINKAGAKECSTDLLLAGDLLNQIITSSFAAREYAIPFIGLYGACSAMTYSLGLAAALIDGEFADNAVCAASSHFCTAERQYRFPLEMGGVRPPSAQWTATGAGAAYVSSGSGKIRITCFTPGRVVDYGIDDVNHMGAAMAPAAANTICSHFSDTGLTPADYDAVITGDLGKYGSTLLCSLVRDYGYDIADRHIDCGIELFGDDDNSVLAGGSGCGCSALYMGKLTSDMLSGRYNRVLMASTGALMSPTSFFQKDTIPAVAHAIALEVSDKSNQ